ncbi:TIGR03089 family protein [Arthrobacter sp. BL-252-APC-1A]|uniref:TIGR03089 family protein n=1 Tax=Arthrobacter sp. BL-252-APC-1A TaxID=2606622 RepID=UPI0012B2E00C|nr:TIGR03089 family protein [Arthrobacter sp. BL-252-APC-1A]MSR98244.1 TIGR03089 family protein [Arthrobacter sp. BL-252-APC-1A]
MTENPVPNILSTLRSEQATSPALIWYGPGSERVELSGKVLDNWVAKTSNYLTEELDAEPGTIVQLDLPAHWKTLVWALAVWQSGCTLALSAVPRVDVRVTAENPEPQGAELVAAVALPALAMAWPGALPAGTSDYSAEVRSFADTWAGPLYRSEPAQPVAGDAGVLGFGLDAGEAPETGRQVVLLPAEAGTAGILAKALSVWAGGGAVVLTGDGVEPTERMLQAERVTARLEA